MDYGKSVVRMKGNPIFQSTQCQYATFLLVTSFSHQLFLLICDFPATKLEETSCLSCVLLDDTQPSLCGQVYHISFF